MGTIKLALIGILLAGLLFGFAMPVPADAGQLASIQITPENPDMEVGQSLVFRAQGYDENGDPCQINDPNWEGDQSYGTITPDVNDPLKCTYTANQAGNGYIICWEGPPYQGIHGSTDIYIQDPGSQLDRIDITPSSVTLQVGGTKQFIATGYDQNDNEIPITPEWTTDGGTISQSGLYTATTEGDFTVTASVQGSTVTGTASVKVTPPGTPVKTATGTGTAYFATDAGTLENLAAVDESTLPAEGKPALVFPHGFFSFNITGLTPCTHQKVVVTITLPSAVPVGTQYWKYHASEGGWIQIPMGSDDGDNVITITLEDGGLGDDDGECNGVIVDSGGPGVGVFDTGSPANPYPSISGTHRGTITLNQTITVSRLYTYPCAGTGGHSEYARIWNTTLNVTARWDGYRGDWHNISFDKTFTLAAHETYNYTIKTGSYPQIHHTSALPTANGWINCTEFVDANGKKYKDGIPAIRLFL